MAPDTPVDERTVTFQSRFHYKDIKKLLIATIALIFVATDVHGQKLRKAEARLIIETAINSLKSGDSTAFVELWHIDNTPAPYHDHPFTEKTAFSYYHYLREFVDTALAQNLEADHIDISKVEAEQRALNFGKYKIKVWFKNTDWYFKGFGFFVEYIDDKWLVRYIPDTSTLTRS